MERTLSPALLRGGIADHLAIGAGASEAARMGIGHMLFAAVMIALGLRGLVVGDFASVWQRIPIADLPAREFIAYACAFVELATGVGLLFKRTLAISSAIVTIYLLLWVILLKVPAIVAMPSMEATWLGFGEISLILAGGWILFATHAGAWSSSHMKFAVGANGVRNARILFALALPMIGLSHFVYAKETVGFVPAWLPYPYGWAYLTGAGSLAASLGVLFGVWPRLASTMEAAMLSVITVLVWAPGMFGAPSNDTVTPFLMSSAIACGAWVVADSYRGVAWRTLGGAARS